VTGSPTPGTCGTSRPARVLLTGVTGFIGSHVARVLVEAGCDVHGLVRPGASRERIADLEGRLTIIEGDLAGLAIPGVLATVAPEICLHLAWYAEPGRYLHATDENLASLGESLGLVEALAASGCRRLVAAGTCAEYGAPAPGASVDELSPTCPLTPYARAKQQFHLAAEDVAAQAGMEMAWARLFFLYGPWEHPARIVPSAVLACLAGNPFPATGGEQVRDYLHVADAAGALWAVAASGLTGVVNVCSGEAVTLRAVLEAVEAATRRPGTVRFGERAYVPGEWMWMVGANAKLLETGWCPAFGLEEGIAEAVAWWRARVAAASAE
jgi:nucleoside-diphosphate-sugar epimerase